MKLRTKLAAIAAALAVTGAATAQIWGPVVGGLVNGGVLFGSGGVVAQDSTKFFWDGTNHRLGIGNAAPAVPLDVTGAGTFSGAVTAGSLVLNGAVTGAVASNAGISGTSGVFSTTLNVTGASTLTGGIVGITGATNATAGNVGEQIESAATPALPATNTYGDMVTVALTAGDWDCSLVALFTSLVAANTTNVLAGISIGTAGNTFSDAVFGSNLVYSAGAPIGVTDLAFSIPQYRVNVSGATTVRAKMRAIYTAGTPGTGVRLSCRRMR